MHKLLARQLRRALGAQAELSSELVELLVMVDEAYVQYDQDRAMLERSLELSSSELLRANGELNAIFSSLPDVFLRVTEGGEVVDCRGGSAGEDPNLRTRRRGATLAQTLAPEAMAAVRYPLEFVCRNRNSTTVQYRIGGGESAMHFEARLLALPERDVMIVIRNVTDRVSSEQAEAVRREQAGRVRAMEEFAYVASHDLRAPLRAIQQLAEWLAEDLGEGVGEETRAHLELLQRRVTRMDDLMVGLLDYARVGRNSVAAEEVDVAALVDGVVELLGNDAFTFEIGPLPRMKTARGPLERVFLNLVTNAVKHHHVGGGRIAIGAEVGSAEVAFFVEDDGPGIPASERERVFKMFEKLERRDTVEGSGMGLALVKRIVEEAGGTIAVAEREQGGARFTFTWPRDWKRGRSSVPRGA